jgi:hypothetical protein
MTINKLFVLVFIILGGEDAVFLSKILGSIFFTEIICGDLCVIVSLGN